MKYYEIHYSVLIKNNPRLLRYGLYVGKVGCRGKTKGFGEHKKVRGMVPGLYIKHALVVGAKCQSDG